MKTLNERFPKIDFDNHSEIQVLKNDEEIIDLHEKWWGGENIRISKAELRRTFKRQCSCLGTEYSHAIALE